MNQKPISQL